jgi:hypothetical protein
MGQALKGKISTNISLNGFETNTPLRGMWVIEYNNKLFPLPRSETTILFSALS